MIGWSVEVTTREPEEGKRQPRCGDIGRNRAADYARGTPVMLEAGSDRGVGADVGGHGSPGIVLVRFGTMPLHVTNSLSSADRFFFK